MALARRAIGGRGPAGRRRTGRALARRGGRPLRGLPRLVCRRAAP